LRTIHRKIKQKYDVILKQILEGGMKNWEKLCLSKLRTTEGPRTREARTRVQEREYCIDLN
jgi:hypothetical protein